MSVRIDLEVALSTCLYAIIAHSLAGSYHTKNMQELCENKKQSFSMHDDLK